VRIVQLKVIDQIFANHKAPGFAHDALLIRVALRPHTRRDHHQSELVALQILSGCVQILLVLQLGGLRLVEKVLRTKCKCLGGFLFWKLRDFVLL
jgi:hypothetical protein